MCQGVLDGGLKGMIGRMAPDGQVLIFELAPDRFDRIEFRTVGREVPKMNVGLGQGGQRRLDRLAVMDRIVVQDHDAGSPPAVRRHPRDPLDEREVGSRIVPPLGLAPGLEQQPWSAGGIGRQGANDVHPSSLGRLVRHDQARSQAAPAEAGGQGRGKAALVEEPQVDQAGRRLFLSPSNSDTLAWYASTSRRLWATEVTVRFQPKRRVCSSRLRWSG